MARRAAETSEPVSSRSKLSVCVPVFNEAESIGDTLTGLRKTLPDSEILVVDDGSTDRTGEILDALTDIELIRNDRNRGYGASLKLAIRRANGEVVAWFDGDGQHDPQDLVRVVEPVLAGDKDAVIGVRPQGSGEASRRSGKWVLNVVAEMIVAGKVPDLNSGMRCFDRSVIRCSIRTMYRILSEHGEVRERRNQLRHPNYQKPELVAEAPNQVWSWDITKLRGPVKWTYFYLYVILDIFSRYVTGWMLARRESAKLARRLISESCLKQNIEADRLTIHADRGSSMRSKSVALLLADLGITKTHSRPYVSNDNPREVKILMRLPDGRNVATRQAVHGSAP